MRASIWTWRSLVLATSFALSCGLFTAPGAQAQRLDQIDIHGFASQGYMNSSNYDYLVRSEDGSAEYQEFAFNMVSRVSDDLRVGLQLFARDLGSLGNNEIELDWAFGDYHWQDQLGFRGGRFKMPYGFYNETSDFDAVRTAVLLPQSVYDLRFRDVMMAVNGLQAYGALDADVIGGFEYSGYFGTIQTDNDGSVANLFNDAGAFAVQDLQFQHAAGAAIVWNTPLDGLRLGETFNHWDMDMYVMLLEPFASMLAGLGASPDQTFAMRNINFWTSSAEYTYGDLVLAAEYSRWMADLRNPFMSDTMNYEKWYAQASYRVNDWVEFGSYYSEHYDDKDDRSGESFASAHRAYQKDLALSLRFDVSHAMIVKAESHFVRGTAQLLQLQNTGLMMDPTSQDENWRFWAVKTSFLF